VSIFRLKIIKYKKNGSDFLIIIILRTKNKISKMEKSKQSFSCTSTSGYSTQSLSDSSSDNRLNSQNTNTSSSSFSSSAKHKFKNKRIKTNINAAAAARASPVSTLSVSDASNFYNDLIRTSTPTMTNNHHYFNIDNPKIISGSISTISSLKSALSSSSNSDQIDQQFKTYFTLDSLNNRPHNINLIQHPTCTQNTINQDATTTTKNKEDASYDSNESSFIKSFMHSVFNLISFIFLSCFKLRKNKDRDSRKEEIESNSFIKFPVMNRNAAQKPILRTNLNHFAYASTSKNHNIESYDNVMISSPLSRSSPLFNKAAIRKKNKELVINTNNSSLNSFYSCGVGSNGGVEGAGPAIADNDFIYSSNKRNSAFSVCSTVATSGIGAGSTIDESKRKIVQIKNCALRQQQTIIIHHKKSHQPVYEDYICDKEVESYFENSSSSYTIDQCSSTTTSQTANSKSSSCSQNLNNKSCLMYQNLYQMSQNYVPSQRQVLLMRKKQLNILNSNPTASCVVVFSTPLRSSIDQFNNCSASTSGASSSSFYSNLPRKKHHFPNDFVYKSNDYGINKNNKNNSNSISSFIYGTSDYFRQIRQGESYC
jgi:hypothetical protein